MCSHSKKETCREESPTSHNHTSHKTTAHVRENMRILFVCTGNAHRSPLAEALLKKLRPDLEVESAGLHVAIPISEEAAEYLAREDATRYLKKTPENLNNKQVNEYDLIVAMEQRHKDAIVIRHPECKNKIVVWNVEDPYLLPSREAEKIYRQIKEKVVELTRSL
jgi:protein-tyrosine-phosphatase